MYHPTRLLITGFAVVIIMMIILSLTALNSIGVADRKVSQQVSQQLDKFNLAVELSTIARDQLQFMQSILLEEEDFAEFKRDVLAEFASEISSDIKSTRLLVSEKKKCKPTLIYLVALFCGRILSTF